MKCPTCMDGSGLCRRGDLEPNVLCITLSEGFEDETAIPCYGRNKFIQKFGLKNIPNTSESVILATADQINFKVLVNNYPRVTTVSGKTWNKFLKLYSMQIGSEFFLDLTTEGPEAPVKVYGLPITHPSYYYLSDEKKQWVDDLFTSDGTKLNWKEMEHVVKHVETSNHSLQGEASSEDGWVSVPLLHKLNATNTVKKQLRLPKQFVPPIMKNSGSLKITYKGILVHEGSYKIFDKKTDGRLNVNGWKEFMNQNTTLKADDLLIFTIYNSGLNTYLHVNPVPRVTL